MLKKLKSIGIMLLPVVPVIMSFAADRISDKISEQKQREMIREEIEKAEQEKFQNQENEEAE